MQHKKKVYCNGVFDMFHAAHVAYLKKASQYGELYVGVHSDEDAASYKRTPIMSYAERCAVVQDCKYVHAVIPDTKLEIKEDFIQQNGIDIVVCSNPDTRYHA